MLKNTARLLAFAEAQGKQMSELDRRIAEVDRKRRVLRQTREVRYSVPDAVALFIEHWNRGFKTHFPDAVGLPLSGAANISRIKKELIPLLNERGIKTPEFAVFVTEHWTYLGSRSFMAKYTRFPKKPAFGWLLRFLDFYIEQFEYEKSDKKVSRQRREEERKREREQREAPERAKKAENRAAAAVRRALDEAREAKRLAKMAEMKRQEVEWELEKLRLENEALRSNGDPDTLARIAETLKPTSYPKWE